MKVLWLGNSDDVGLAADRRGGRSIDVAQRLLEEDTGGPVEITGRVIWPSPGLPDLIGGWVERYEPDVVMFKVNGYWYLYRSVPLRLERAFGRVAGGSIAKAGRATADIPWLAHTRAYHAARRMARRTIGAATFFTPAEVAGIVDRCIRRILQSERVGVVVWSPVGAWEGAPAGAAEHVFDALDPLCRQLGVIHVAWKPGTPDPTADFFETGDRIHRANDGHNWYGEREARAINSAWQAATTGVPAPPFSLDA